MKKARMEKKKAENPKKNQSQTHQKEEKMIIILTDTEKKVC